MKDFVPLSCQWQSIRDKRLYEYKMYYFLNEENNIMQAFGLSWFMATSKIDILGVNVEVE